MKNDSEPGELLRRNPPHAALASWSRCSLSSPRVTKNGTYFSASYRDWRSAAHLEILSQLPAGGEFPKSACLSSPFSLTGSHLLDADEGCAGACLDALVSAGVLLSRSLLRLRARSARAT